MSKIEEVEVLIRRAKDFLSNAKHLLTEGVYDLSAFNSEQALQLYMKAILLEKLGDYPKSHSLKFIAKQLAEISVENSRNS